MSDNPATVVPAAGFSELPPGSTMDEAVVALRATATFVGTAEAGRERLAALRADPGTSIYGLTVNGELVAVYGLRRVYLSMEIINLAVAPEHRRRGYGRRALADALRRSGSRPLVAETDDDALGFYRACGFKLIGRRRLPNGITRYRLGAHAPRPVMGATSR